MRVLRPASLFISILVFASLLAAQQPPQRDPQALATLEKAIGALGGAAISLVRDASVRGTIQILTHPPNETVSFVWEDAWANGVASYRRESHQGTSSDILVSSGRHPVTWQNGITTKVPDYTSFSCAPIHLPGVVLASQFSRTSYDLKFLGTAIVNGQTAVHVQSALHTDPVAASLSSQDWYFDPNSGLPLRAEYRIATSSDFLNPGVVSMEFADFRSVSGVLIPFRLAETGLHGEKDVATVTSATINSGLSSTEFTPPPGDSR